MEALLDMLGLGDSNTRTVALGVTVLGLAAGIVGALAVLRKRALMGDAVAHAALPGICVAYLIVGERHFGALLLGALLFGILAAAFVSAVRTLTRVKEDAAIGIAIGGFFGLGIVLSRIIQNEPSGNRAGLDSFIFGKAASMVRDDARIIVVVAAGVLMVTTLLYKELKLLCFDREFAAGLGRPTSALDLLLMTLVCLCTVVGLPAVGVVLIVALLIIPGAAARFWTNRLGPMLILAGIFGAGAGLIGTLCSAWVPPPPGALTRGWPTGPLVTLAAAAVFIVSLLGAPRRGVIADLLRRAAVRRKINRQNILRAVAELEEQADPANGAAMSDLARRLHLAPGVAARRARGLIDAGLAEGDQHHLRLTSTGHEAARKIVRAHRLWERYLIEQAAIAPDHVDRDADEIEHILPPETIAQLETRLKPLPDLPSPHPLGRVP